MLEYDVIKELQRTNSSKEKVAILKRNDTPLLRLIFCYAYDKRLVYHIKKFDPYAYGYSTLGDKFFHLLDDLNHKLILGSNLIRHTVEENIVLLDKESQSIATRILNRDLECGVGIKTINRAFNVNLPEEYVMLAKPCNKRQIKYPCVVQTKLDGVRAFTKYGDLFSREGKKFVGMSHFPYLTSGLDGELIVPHVSFETLVGMVKDHMEHPEIEYHIFDYMDTSMPYGERIQWLRRNIIEVPNIFIVPAFRCNNKQQLETAFATIERLGYEGLMVKPPNHKYEFKRSNRWLKLKVCRSTDLKIIDVEMGKGKFSDVVGAIICDYRGTPVRVGSGFSDAQREAFTLNPPIGEIAEIKYQNITSKGSLRHPVFKCIKEGL